MRHPSVHLSGHGISLPSEQVFVPPHQSVHFYAPLGHRLAAPAALGALLAGAGPVWSARGSAEGTVTCANVALSPMNDREVVTDVGAAGDAVNLVHAGDPRFPLVNDALTLCENPSGCLADGHHACGGWLDHFADVADIHVITCLGIGENRPPSYALTPFDTDDEVMTGDTYVSRHDAAVQDFLALPEDERARLWPGLPTGTRSLLMTNRTVERWFVLHSAREHHRRHGDFAFARYTDAQPHADQVLLSQDHELGQVLDRVHGWLGNWLCGTRLHVDAAEEMANLDERDRAALTGWPAVAKIVEFIEEGVALWPDGISPQDESAAIFEHNRRALSAVTSGFVDCLIGDDDLLIAPPELGPLSSLDEVRARQTDLVLHRLTSDWNFLRAAIRVRAAAGGVLVLSGEPVRVHRERWADLAAELPHLAFEAPVPSTEVTTTGSGLIDVSAWPSLDSSGPVHAATDAVLAAVARYNAIAAGDGAEDRVEWLSAVLAALWQRREATERLRAAIAAVREQRRAISDWFDAVVWAQGFASAAAAGSADVDWHAARDVVLPALPELTWGESELLEAARPLQDTAAHLAIAWADVRHAATEPEPPVARLQQAAWDLHELLDTANEALTQLSARVEALDAWADVVFADHIELTEHVAGLFTESASSPIGHEVEVAG
ncbi:hypothetical protein [Lentzea sp. E54]|uniref:hypothetical protein n=1 Tax=Lentzea xerophila TaxID=3435883 RepID=UPI003DA5FF95